MKHKSLIIILAGLLTVLSVIPAHADEKQDVAKADKLLTQGNYKEAIQSYNGIIAKYGTSAGLLYNLATAYTKSQDYGNAMLALERARKLDPTNSRIKGNIEYVENKVADANRLEVKGKQISVDPDSKSFVRGLYDGATRSVSSDLWSTYAAIAFALCIISIALYIFCRPVSVRKTGFFGAFIFAGISIVCLVFAFCAASEIDNHDVAVITAHKVELTDSPSDNAKATSIKLARGTKVSIIEASPIIDGKSEWYRVRLNSDNAGWVRAADLEAI